MVRRSLLALLTVLVIFTLVTIAVYLIDRSQTMKWVGVTNLDLDFLVIDADTQDPIPNARVEIFSNGGFYDGGDEEDQKTFDLRTDATGVARRRCGNNRCIGTQSRLLFTDTYHVYTPMWRVRALALGHEPSPWVWLYDEYRGKAIHEALQSDRLVVEISLKKVVEIKNGAGRDK